MNRHTLQPAPQPPAIPQRVLLLTLLFALAFQFCHAQLRTESFDNDWKFHKGGALSAENTIFDDAAWQSVDLPHDWSIEDLPGTQSPFHADAISSVGGGFTVGGTGWYRKTFVHNVAASMKTIIQFDGVYMNSDIWLNGQLLGNHPYGYTSFWFDITDKLVAGKNVIAVKVRNEGENSRWYSGSGIYRHVWLTTSGSMRIAPWGTAISTSQNGNSTRVKIKTTLAGPVQESSVRVAARILDAAGTEVGKTESTHTFSENGTAEQSILITNPKLWSLTSPVLYTLVSEVYSGQELTDRTETKFGIRTLLFSSANGFTLNGENIKLKGGCIHHDHGPLGAKSFDRAEERKVELLKASGYNAIRCSHNPPSPAFLDACDRLGMLVIDEAFDMWTEGKNAYDYHLYYTNWWKRDVASMVLRDRNHPSVILWSIGNEIPGMEETAVIAQAKTMAAEIHSLDPTRLVTAAVNSLSEKKDPFFSALDVAGYNYAAGGDHNQKSIYETDHGRKPERIMYGSESYAWEAFGAWMNVVDYPYVIGDFVWTAFDYIGEASIGWRGYWQEQNFYPWSLAYCGDIDICGWKRPQSFYRDALWKPNQVSVFVTPPTPSFPLNPKKESWSKWDWHDVVADWNWKGQEGKPLDVVVYSSCDQVELLLNGKSLGKKIINRTTAFQAQWSVPYAAGELRAVGYQGKKKVNESILSTAGEATQLRLTADRNAIQSGGQDLSYVTVELIDSKGLRNPKAEDLIQFTISGNGSIVGVGNANPASLESYQQPHRKAWLGRCLVIVKSGKGSGPVTLIASSAAQGSTSLTIETK